MTKKPSRSEQILKLAEASPGIKSSQAAEILGMSKESLSVYASKLRKEGKLKRTRGTLELADGTSALVEVAPPAEKKPSRSKKPKSPKISDEDLETIRPLIREGTYRAEQYRQEGVLSNILVVRKADGEITVRGIMGSGALLCVMIGKRTREGLEDIEFQAGMAGLVASLGDGSGEAAVFYNLTDLGGDDAPQAALVCAWIGGRRVICTQAPISTMPLTSGEIWKDLTDKQAGNIYDSGVARAKLADSEDGVSGTAVRDVEPSDGTRSLQALSAIMSDPQRAPVLNISASFRDGGMQIGMAMARPEVISAVADAGFSEDSSSDSDQLAPAGQPADPSAQVTDPETDFIVALINQACARVEEERLSGSLMNFVVVGMEDGSSTVVGVGGGQILPMMTGVMGDQIDVLIASMGQGRGTSAVFVSMMDLASDGVDVILLSAWSQGNRLRTALSARIGAEPLDSWPEGWREVDPVELREIGDHDMQLRVANEEQE